MRKIRQGSLSLLLCYLALNCPVFADKPALKSLLVTNKPNHFEVIGALGIANFNAANSQLGVTSSETDKLVQTNRNNWNALTGQLGLGYVSYLHDAQQYSDKAQWFPSIEPELNVYQLSSDSGINGDVWRFNSSDFNQLNYKMPVQSTRLMLDAALTIVSKRNFSLYAIGGIGNAWNRISYSDTDKDISCTNQTINIRSHNTSAFAWEAGIGVAYAVNTSVSFSLEYLYTSLGTVKTSAVGTTGTITAPIIVPAQFKLKSQTGLFGVHIALGK